MKYEFRVDGLPPEKDGANSMWGKESERGRIVSLREAAWLAVGDGPPLQTGVQLTLRIYVGRENNRQTGDLDTFVTGVCDALMQADDRARMAAWSPEELAIVRPNDCIVMDDCQVVSISAKKFIGKDPGEWYEVVLEGE